MHPLVLPTLWPRSRTQFAGTARVPPPYQILTRKGFRGPLKIPSRTFPRPRSSRRALAIRKHHPRILRWAETSFLFLALDCRSPWEVSTRPWSGMVCCDGAIFEW